MHWIYTAIVRPTVSYAAIVWWKKCKQSTVRKKLTKLQRLACLLISGVSNSTPTAAIELLLDLAPLHLHVEYEAMSTNFRFKTSEIPLDRDLYDAYFGNLQRNYELLGCTEVDEIRKRYIFQKNFEVTIPEREDWINIDLNEKVEADLWYTDGSLTDTGTGCGIYCSNNQESLSFHMGRSATVFQAEVQAINECCSINLERTVRDRIIIINSDSQAALKALNNSECRSRLVYDTVIKLNQLGLENKIVLRWVPAHRGYTGNEIADALAKEGANTVSNGPHWTHTPWSLLKSNMQKWLYNECNNYFRYTTGLKHAKAFIIGTDKKRCKLLLNLKRNQLRLVAGFLAGHYPTKERLVKMKLATDDTCRFCVDPDVKETNEHILCDCVALERTRYRIFNFSWMEPQDLKGFDVTRIYKFLKEIGI